MSGMKMLLFCTLVCIVSWGTVYWFSGREQKKIAVIDAVKLFDGYNMKRELEDIAKVKLTASGRQLDSLNNILQMAKGLKKSEEEIRHLSDVYSYLKAKLQEDYTQSDREINAQVWKRLNSYLEEYGKKKKLHLIIGANGMGSVLYTDGYYDLTDDAIVFINEKYAAGN